MRPITIPSHDILESVAIDIDGSNRRTVTLAQFRAGAFALVVTDLAMPRVGGLELVQEIRKTSDLPILVLTVRNEEREKVRLLDAGADDYLTKPFGVAELVARVRALLRRGDPVARRHGPIRWADIAVDVETREVEKAGKRVHLTPIESRS